MEWFNQLPVALRIIIVYGGALAIIVGVSALLLQLTLGFLEAVIPHPKTRIIYEDKSYRKVRFPYEDLEFYRLMLISAAMGSKILVTLDTSQIPRYSHLLFSRFTSFYPEDKVMETDDFTLTSKKVGENKYLISSHNEKSIPSDITWIFEVKEGEKEYEYTLTPEPRPEQIYNKSH